MTRFLERPGTDATHRRGRDFKPPHVGRRPVPEFAPPILDVHVDETHVRHHAAIDLDHERGRRPGPPSLMGRLDESFGICQRVGGRHAREPFDRGILTDGRDESSVGGTGATEHSHTEVECPVSTTSPHGADGTLLEQPIRNCDEYPPACRRRITWSGCVVCRGAGVLARSPVTARSRR